LYSHISALEFLTEPLVYCPNTDAGMSPFIKVACAIGGHEYLACGQYPLSIGFSLREIADGVTPMLKLKVPLPKFHIAHTEEDEAKFFSEGGARDEKQCGELLPLGARSVHQISAERRPPEPGI
jgi:hypothetical protein